MASNTGIANGNDVQLSPALSCKLCTESCLNLWDSDKFHKHAVNAKELSLAAKTCLFCSILDKALDMPKALAGSDMESAEDIGNYIFQAVHLGMDHPADEDQIQIRPWRSDSGALFIEVKENNPMYPYRSKLHWFVRPGMYILQSCKPEGLELSTLLAFALILKRHSSSLAF
jgi:hypothetical protein